MPTPKKKMAPEVEEVRTHGVFFNFWCVNKVLVCFRRGRIITAESIFFPSLVYSVWASLANFFPSLALKMT